jgi:hypothetical protein
VLVDFHSVEVPVVRSGHRLELFLGLGEGDVQPLLAVAGALDQKLQAEGRLADARVALQEIDVIAGEAPEENVVETFDSGRGDFIF